MKSYRFWLFQAFIAATIALMIVSFIGPWWTAYVESMPELPATVNIVIDIYQWGIPEGMQSEYWAADITPFYQVVLARIFLAASIILAISSSWLKGKWGKLLLGLIGISWIAYAIGALILISTRTEAYGISMQGTVTLDAYNVVVTSSLQTGYYMSYAAGLLCIVLTLTRNWITSTNREIQEVYS